MHYAFSCTFTLRPDVQNDGSLPDTFTPYRVVEDIEAADAQNLLWEWMEEEISGRARELYVMSDFNFYEDPDHASE